jgi:hypothetical protein
LRIKLGVLGFKRVGDVLEEDQSENHVLVLRRVHVIAQRIGRGPQLRFKAEIGTRLCLRSRLSFRRHCVLILLRLEFNPCLIAAEEYPVRRLLITRVFTGKSDWLVPRGLGDVKREA